MASKNAAMIAAALLTAAITAACTMQMDGTATRPTSTTSGPGAVNAALLNVGNYPTKPRPPLGSAGTADRGSLLEAQRLANYTTNPWEVDPQLATPVPFGIGPGSLALVGAKSFSVFFSDEQNAALSTPGFVNGFATARELAKQRELYNIVLRFSDPAAASAAASNFQQTLIAHPVKLPPPIPTTPVTIPGHPEALAATHQFLDSDINQTWTIVDSFTAHGPFVLMQRAQVIGPVDGAATLVSKTLDLQGPAIDKYTLTDPAQFPSVPRDPSGLLARALPEPKGAGTPNSNMTLDAHGSLNFDAAPQISAKSLADAGVDVVVSAAGWIYQTKDAAAATALLNADVSFLQASGPVNDSVPNLPGSHCQVGADRSGVTCMATADRYVIEVSTNTLKDAQQQTAAQYLMLTAK